MRSSRAALHAAGPLAELTRRLNAPIDIGAENARCGNYFRGATKVYSCLNVPYPEYDETRRNWLLLQPSIGLDARIWRGIGFRARLDVLGLVNRDWGMEWAPRMSTQIVIGFGD